MKTDKCSCHQGLPCDSVDDYLGTDCAAKLGLGAEMLAAWESMTVDERAYQLVHFLEAAE